jgi:RNA polymerase sigma-70 factor (ECF subfamily)
MNDALSAALSPHEWPAEEPAAAGNATADGEPTLPLSEEKRLATLAVAGDLDAFNQLVERIQGSAYTMAYRLLHDEEAAADVVQESLIKAFRALPTYRGGSFKSWFLRIVINSCYDLLRAEKRRAVVSLDDRTAEGELAFDVADRGERPEEHVARMELQQWLARGLAALPMEQRIAVVLFDVEGYSYNEIVEITEVPVGTVKSRINRGRIRLRDFLVRHRVLTV